MDMLIDDFENLSKDQLIHILTKNRKRDTGAHATTAGRNLSLL
jgi:hypothetical protein